MIYYRCLYCTPPSWQPVNMVPQHMHKHREQGDDVGTYPVPVSYQELVRRWSSLGILEEIEK